MSKPSKKPKSKRLTKEQLRRSEAAKKGWKKRKTREAKAALVAKLRNERTRNANAIKARTKTAPKKKAASKGGNSRVRGKQQKTPTKKELLRQLAEEKAKRVKAEKAFKREVDKAFEVRRKRIDEKTKVDENGEKLPVLDENGFPDFESFVPTRIGQPEWLHRDGTLAVAPCRLRWLPEPEYSNLVKKLKRVKREGSAEDFQDFADVIADFFDVDIREVYTLECSP